MSSDFINGDRSPIPPDKQPQSADVSLSDKRPQIQGSSLSNPRLIQSDSLNVERQKTLLSQISSPSLLLGSYSREGVNPLGGQGNHDSQIDLLFQQATEATRSRNHEGGHSDQNLGLRPQGVNSDYVNSGNLQWRPIPSGMLLNQVLSEPGIARSDGVIQSEVNSVGNLSREAVHDLILDFPPLSSGQKIIEDGQCNNNGGLLSQRPSIWEAMQTRQVIQGNWNNVLNMGASRYALDKKNMNKDNGVLLYPEEVMMRGSNEWKNVVVGFFFDNRLGFKFVEGYLRKRWKLKGRLNINADKENFYLRFTNEEDRKMVLEEGPLFINGKVFLLREWSVDIDIEKRGCKTLPIWARFWDVPKFMWNKEGFSYLASAIGEPLFTDRMTMDMRRLGYARMCIQVDTNFDFPDKLKFRSGLREFDVDVEYQWVPPKCRNCNSFGHYFHNCKEKLNKEAARDVTTEKETTQTDRATTVLGVERNMANQNVEIESETTQITGTTAMKETNSNVITQDMEKGAEILQNDSNITMMEVPENDVTQDVGEQNDTEVNATLEVECVNGIPVTEIEKTDNVQGKENITDNVVTTSEKNDLSVQKQDSNEVNNNKNMEADWTENKGGGRRFMGRHEVVYSQKERARTRSGMALQTNNPYSSLEQKENEDLMIQFMEEYDEDGCSEPDEDDIPMLNGVPNILKSYSANNKTKVKLQGKVNLQGKKVLINPKVVKGKKNQGR